MRTLAKHLVAAAAVAGLAPAPASVPAQEAGTAGEDSPSISVERLGDDVWLLRDGLGSGNVLLFDHPEGAYLVDAGSPASAAAVARAADSLAAHPVQTVVSTHYHTDHLGANPLYRRRGARIMGHDRLSAQASRDTVIPEISWHREAADPAALPTIDITTPALISDAGGEAIVAIQRLRGAHSDTDLLVYLPRARILHVGDVVEVGAYPFIDWWSGGSLDGMIEEVDRLLGWVGPEDRIVPGHGEVIGRNRLSDYRTLLVTVRDRANDAIRRGESREAFLASRPTREFDAVRGGPEAGRRFAKLVWWGLSRGAGAR